MEFPFCSVLFASDDDASHEFVRDYFGLYCSFSTTISETEKDSLPRVTLCNDRLSYQEFAACIEGMALSECGGTYLRCTPGGQVDILIDTDPTVSRGRFPPMLVVDASRGSCLAITMEGGDISYFFAMRAIRALVQIRYVNRGSLAFHAASFHSNGYAICLAGDKFAGKTTALLHALIHHGGEYMANDCTYIDPDSNRVMAHTLPVSARIRQGTLDLLPELGHRLADLAHNHIDNHVRTVMTPRGMESRLFASPEMLASALGCSTCHTAPLGAIIFPSYNRSSETSRIERVDNITARSMLLSVYLDDPVPHQPYWSAFAVSPGRDAVDAALCHILSQVPVYRLITGRYSLQEPPKWVDTIVSRYFTRQ